MSSTTSVLKPLLAGSLIATFLLVGNAVIAEDKIKVPKVFVDPVTGEVSEVSKLLSEMTEEEKSRFTSEELQRLEQVEAQAKKAMKEGAPVKPEY